MSTVPAPHSSSRLRHRFLAGRSGILVVVFSQVRVPDGKFGLERLFSGTRHSCLFFNDPANHWYLGLDDAINRQIDLAIKENNPDRIIYYGSSMGGTAALSFGLNRNDGGIHAFGAELRPGRPWSQSRQFNIEPNDPRFWNIKNLAAQTRPRKPHLYYGCFDGTDAGNAALAANWFKNAHLHFLASTHASHDHLYTLNIIRKIIKTFERPPEKEIASRQLYHAVHTGELEAFGTFQEQRCDVTPAHVAGIAAVPGFQLNPGLRLLQADLLSSLKDYSSAAVALAQLDRDVIENPVWKTLPKRWQKLIPIRLTRCLIEAGQEQLATDILRSARSRFPADDEMIDLARKLGFEFASAATD